MLSSGFAGAAGTSGLAGGASGFLGAMGGPAGLAFAGAAGIGSSLLTNEAAEASAQAAKEREKFGYVAGISGQEFLTNREFARQMDSLDKRALARKSGLYGPEDFQNLLSSGLSPSAARRELYSPIFRGAA
jgi:hypothetical protein